MPISHLGLSVAVGIVILMIIFSLRFLANLGKMQKPDRILNPVRIKPRGGEIEIYAKGNPNGPPARVVPSVPGWRYDEKRDFMEEKEEPETFFRLFFGYFGAVWVGLFMYRSLFVLKWNDYAKQPGKTEYQIVPREELTATRLYFQTVMGVEEFGAKTSEKFQVNILAVLTLRIIRPKKAAYFAGDLYTQATGAIQGGIRGYTSVKTYAKLLAEKEDGNKGLTKALYDLNDGPHGLIEKFGVAVHDVRLPTVEISHGDEDAERAAQAKGVAEMLAEGVRATAQGEADADAIKGEGRARAIDAETAALKRRVVEHYGAMSSIPRGAHMFRSEAIRDTKVHALAVGDEGERSGHIVLTADVSKD